MIEQQHYILECKPKDIEEMMHFFEFLKENKQYVVVLISTKIRNSRVTKVSAERFKKEIE
jgi:hypothetical protein